MEVFICGTEQQVARIKECLKEKIKICGCADLKENVASFPSLDKSVFFIADDTQNLSLAAHGISTDRILRYDLFPQTYFDNPIEGFSQNSNALIIGMSHSQCALDTELMSNASAGKYQYFKESAPSLDLFLHEKLFEKMEEHNSSALRGLQRVIIEIPYYIFNYDLSLFGDFSYTKLNYFESAGNYHHLWEKDSAKAMIEMFHLYWSTFNQSYYTAPPSRILPPYLIPAKKAYHIYKAIRNADKVWYREYEETIRENTSIWNILLTKIKQCCPRAEITILVMPFNPAFRLSHKKQIKQSKRTFYSCLGHDVRVIDDFDYIKNPSLFQDHCHMNEKGGSQYSKHLAAELR